jgi:hypothetical protein
MLALVGRDRQKGRKLAVVEAEEGCNAEMTDYDVLLSRKAQQPAWHQAAGPLRPVRLHVSAQAEAGRVLGRVEKRSHPSHLENDFKQAIG